ncbi:Synaptotagmin-7 [Nymphon striatum]|nr:Synaptotagmin-7 [Nymphon striatum]
MVDSAVFLAIVVASIAAVASMSISLMIYYFCCKKRCASDKMPQELEPLQHKTFNPTDKVVFSTNERDDVKKLTRHNVEDRIYHQNILSKQGSIKLKSPTMKTKPVPVQVPETRSIIPEEKTFPQFSPPYFKKQDSVTEIPIVNPAGSIRFTIDYDFHQSTLIVKIIEAVGLPAKDARGTSDPYARVYLLPDKKIKLETKVRRKSLNPKWNESFYFENYPSSKLQNRVLHIKVLDYDRFSRDDPIGETNVVLAQVDLTQKMEMWRTLQQTSKLGELLLSLIYNPTKSILTVGVLKAKNLKAKDITGSSDPYVKVWLNICDKKVEKKKTRVIKTCLAPTFNENFEFIVPWDKIRTASLIISVMDHDTIGRNESIGRVILATKSGPTEAKHWNDMITKLKTEIAQWHQLMAS